MDRLKIYCINNSMYAFNSSLPNALALLFLSILISRWGRAPQWCEGYALLICTCSCSMIPDSECLPSFSFTYQSCSTCLGLKLKKRNCKKLIKDSKTQSLSLVLSSRLPGFFFPCQIFYATKKPNSKGLVKSSCGGHCPGSHSPTSSSGTHVPC